MEPGPLTRLRGIRAVLTVSAVLACSDRIADPAADRSTWGRIQADILDRACVSCHTAGNAYARQSGLVLDKGVAYLNLVDAAPVNPNAVADGMRRVVPGKPDLSLLYHKLLPAGVHTRQYGSPMPLGDTPLFNGQIQFVRQWIEAGAPRSGDVSDTLLLLDRTRAEPLPFAPLPPPAAGYQLTTNPFAIQPAFERELFVIRRLGNPTEIYVNRIETRMRPGSHHLLLLSFREGTPAGVVPATDLVRDIRNRDGTLNLLNLLPMAYHVFLAGSMTPESDFRFPDGVALGIPADARVDVNSHYVNRGANIQYGEAWANLHTVPRAQITHIARTFDLGNSDIVLPPNRRTTLRKTFTFNTTVNVLTLTSHMHEAGEEFVIRIAGGPRDGEVVYRNTDWAHPEIRTFSPPLQLRPGEGLTSEITWNNRTQQTIRFGLTSRDEMGIIFGYWY